MTAPEPEFCLDARLVIGLASGSAVSAVVSLAWGSPIAAIVQASAGLVLAAMAVWASRQRRPTPAEARPPVESSAVSDAIRTLTGEGSRRAGA